MLTYNDIERLSQTRVEIVTPAGWAHKFNGGCNHLKLRIGTGRNGAKLVNLNGEYVGQITNGSMMATAASRRNDSATRLVARVIEKLYRNEMADVTAAGFKVIGFVPAW